MVDYFRSRIQDNIPYERKEERKGEEEQGEKKEKEDGEEEENKKE